jgi:hypoxia induced protein
MRHDQFHVPDRGSHRDRRAVAVVLLLGLIHMMRGGSPNRSQQLMRLRVLLQFVAIVVIMFTVWLMPK